jgi:hypothetical protein
VQINSTKVDSIKYLRGVNTQIRCLPILTAIIQRVGMAHLRVEQLHIYLLDWHKEQLVSSEFYKNHNGQIGEKTSKAYEYYIKFLEQIGLLVRENDLMHKTWTHLKPYFFIYNRKRRSFYRRKIVLALLAFEKRCGYYTSNIR